MYFLVHKYCLEKQPEHALPLIAIDKWKGNENETMYKEVQFEIEE